MSLAVWNTSYYGMSETSSLSSPVQLERLPPKGSSMKSTLRCISGYVLLASEKDEPHNHNFLLNAYRVLGWPEARISSISLTSTKDFWWPGVAWFDNVKASSSVDAVFDFCSIRIMIQPQKIITKLFERLANEVQLISTRNTSKENLKL